jgi:hypothetical protein
MRQFSIILRLMIVLISIQAGNAAYAGGPVRQYYRLSVYQIYVLIPFNSAAEVQKLNNDLQKDKNYQAAGQEYLDAAFSTPPYARIETIILYAFPLARACNCLH